MLVAAAQLSPVFLNRDATVERAIAAIHEASAHGARLIVFPEAFIPGYPIWVWSIPAGDTHALRALYVELLRESVSVPDETTERLCRAARDARMIVVIGVNERNSEASNTSLFNSALFIDDSGRLLGTRRKLVPTSGERLVHAMAAATKFDTLAARNTVRHPPPDAAITLVSGTSSAAVPFAVYSRPAFALANFDPNVSAQVAGNRL